jgi:hypothetical protein
MQCQIDDEGKNDQTDDADGQALSVDCNRCKRSGGKSDDGDNDGCLCHWLGFYFEGEFHPGSQGRWGRLKKWAQGRVYAKALV